MCLRGTCDTIKSDKKKLYWHTLWHKLLRNGRCTVLLSHSLSVAACSKCDKKFLMIKLLQNANLQIKSDAHREF